MVNLIKLVDQQYNPICRFERLKKRARHKVGPPNNLRADLIPRACLFFCLERYEQVLQRSVVIAHGLLVRDSLIALEADKSQLLCFCHTERQLRLARASWAFKK